MTTDNNNADDKPLNREQRNALGFYILGYSECLNHVEAGAPLAVLKAKLAEFAQKLQRSGGSDVAPRLKDYLA